VPTVGRNDPPTRPRRRIGPIGTTARTIVGALLLGSVIQGHLAGPFRPTAWTLGLLGFPALLLGWQWLRAQRTPTPVQATGLVANVANIAVFLALYLTPGYAPALAVTSDAALIFYGASMLLAALRGYAGCEVLAVSNWLLGRDDQIGCMLFGPIDHAERRRTHAKMSASH
jgi:hypothetical protein